jgi:hypothetical protein
VCIGFGLLDIVELDKDHSYEDWYGGMGITEGFCKDHDVVPKM